MGCMGLLPLLGLVVTIAAVAVAVILAVRHAAPRPAGREGEPGAILDRRLASGEIDVDEYHELASALRSVQPAGASRAGRRA